MPSVGYSTEPQTPIRLVVFDAAAGDVSAGPHLVEGGSRAQTLGCLEAIAGLGTAREGEAALTLADPPLLSVSLDDVGRASPKRRVEPFGPELRRLDHVGIGRESCARSSTRSSPLQIQRAPPRALQTQISRASFRMPSKWLFGSSTKPDVRRSRREASGSVARDTGSRRRRACEEHGSRGSTKASTLAGAPPLGSKAAGSTATSTVP